MRITTSKFWALCCALTVALSGCDKTTTPTDLTTDTQSITVTMPLEDTGVISRAGDPAAEVAIKSAHIIIYAAKAAGTALPKYTATIDVKTIAVDEANNKVLIFPKDKGIVAGDDVRVVFNHPLTSLAIAKGGLKDALKITTATSVTSAGLVDITKGLPMYGVGVWGSSIKGGTVVSVMRGVAKVQLLLDCRNGNHVDGVMGAGYTTANTTFKLYQLSNVGHADGSFATSTGSEAVTGITNEDEINQPTVSTAAVDNFTGASYIFAYPYSTQSIGAKPLVFVDNTPKTERLAMIMKNTFEGKTLYHRLDIYDPTSKTYLNIENNRHYIIKLREVNVGGYPTADMALINPPSNIQYDVIVEEDGDVIVSNGQYVLNVNTRGSEFAVTSAAGAEELVEVAVVNLVDSKNAPLDEDPAFSVTLEEYFRVSHASNDVVITPPVNTTLGRSLKSLNIKAKGAGVVSFRYTATLGNIVHTSNLITIDSNFGVISIKNFGETLTFNVKSFLNTGDWSVVSDSPSWAPATKDGDKLKVVVANNPSDDPRTVKITVTNGKDATISITINQRGFPYFADRNVGTSWDLTTPEQLCLPANSKPINALSWQTQEPRRWFAWQESLEQCKDWGFQGKKWRQPTKEDFTVLLSSGRLKSGAGFNTAAALLQSDGVEIYFPMVGYSGDPTSVRSYYWSSDEPNIGNAYNLSVYPSNHFLDYFSKNYGVSVRCVLVYL